MSEVSNPLVCGTCGSVVHEGDEYCEVCGMRLIGPNVLECDPTLCPAPDLGAATHVGRSHATDEDAIALGRHVVDGAPAHLIVVCDGVSSSSHGEQASASAAVAARDVLLAAVTGATDVSAALGEAVRAAHRAACNAPIARVEGKELPGTTFVAAVAQRGRVDLAWVGDSRAYLLGSQDSLLTYDHSWVNEMVTSRAMTEEEAMRSPNAHALTHCIGPLETTDPEAAPEPRVSHVLADAGSTLVVCSDGLWNYFPTAADISALTARIPAGADAGTIARELVQRAMTAGGHDDITVGVALL